MIPLLTEVLLNKYGWTVECSSPLEIRHIDGSRATIQAAEMVIRYVEEWNDEDVTPLAKE